MKFSIEFGFWLGIAIGVDSGYGHKYNIHLILPFTQLDIGLFRESLTYKGVKTGYEAAKQPRTHRKSL